MTQKAFDIDDSLWKEFRKKCTAKDTTIRNQLTKMVKEYIEEN